MPSFMIVMNGTKADAAEFKDLVASFGIPQGTRPGKKVNIACDDSDPNRWVVVATDIPSKLVKDMKSAIVNYSESHSCTHLSIQTEENMFNVLKVPEEYLDDFLKDPKGRIFPPVSTIADGVKKCLHNAIQLNDSVGALLESGRELGPASFLLLTSLEELGKASLIIRATKEAVGKGHRVAAIKGFRDHSEKIRIATEQLMPIAQKRHMDSVGFISFLDTLRIGGFPLDFKAGSLGSLRREYGLYVNYFSHSENWKSFKDLQDPLSISQFGEENIRSLQTLLRICCDALMEEVESRPIHNVRELEELFESRIYL